MNHRSRRTSHSSSGTLLALLVVALWPADHATGTDREIKFHGDSTIRFATAEESARFLATSDLFSASLSRFDRQSRVGTGEELSEREFLAFAAKHALDWTDNEMERLTDAAGKLAEKLAALRVPLPPQVWLIKTSGQEEGNAAYCRRHAIIVPQRMLSSDAGRLERLLAHELFHIASRHDRQWRSGLYKIIGFELVPPIELPLAMRNRKITNPDAPVADCVMQVRDAKQSEMTVTPVLYATVEQFDPEKGGPFFKYLEFRLMRVHKPDKSWEPLLVEGNPVMLEPTELADFRRQIGDNTGYIIHPDEILADNFVHLVFASPNLPNPEIIDRLRQQLQPQ